MNTDTPCTVTFTQRNWNASSQVLMLAMPDQTVSFRIFSTTCVDPAFSLLMRASAKAFSSGVSHLADLWRRTESVSQQSRGE